MRKKGAFIRGRRFLDVGRLFEAIRYIHSIFQKLPRSELIYPQKTFREIQKEIPSKS